MTTTFKVVANNARSTLAAAIDDAALALTVATGEGALFPAAGSFWITIDDEILLCTSRTADVLTVERGDQDTDAAAHVIGSTVRNNITAEQITDIQTAINALE